MTQQPPEYPAITVVIPCLGHADVLVNCLDALERQTLPDPFEVIVVDSACDDAVAAAVARFQNVKLVRSDDRLAPGPARNLGAAAATAELLAFTDADCVPEPEFLGSALQALATGSRAVTGPVLDVPTGYVPACDNLLQFVDFPPSRAAGKADYAPGCNLALRKNDCAAVGGFPDGGAEDARLCLALNARWPGGLLYEPGMRVRHLGRPTVVALMEHHRDFGVQRARYGVRISDRQRRFARYRLAIPAIVGKKLGYIFARIVQYNPRRLPFLAVALPLVMVGLVAWSQGFRAELTARDRGPT